MRTDLGKRRFFAGVLTACVVLGIALCACRDSSDSSGSPTPLAQRPPQPAPQPVLRIDFTLGPHRQSQQRLAGSVVHRYDFTLQSGQLLHAIVDQDVVADQAIDVGVRLFGPDGELFEINSHRGKVGSEEIYLLAESPGTYGVEVDGSGRTGTYRLRLLSIRKASPADRVNFQAERLFYHARALARSHHYSQAVDEYLAAERLWRDLGNKRRRANAYELAANILRDHNDGDWEKTREITEQALRLYRSLSDRRSEAKMLVWTGIAHRSLGELDLAESCYRRAVRMTAEREYQEEKAEALMNLGILLNQRGRKSEAIEAYEESLEVWRREGRADAQASILNYIGQVHASLGKYELARDAYIQAWQALRNEPQADGPRAPIFTRLAEVSRKEGDLDSALFYARLALRLLKKAEKPRDEAVALAEIGLIHKRKGDLRRARDFQEQALAIFHKLNDSRFEATARFNLGLILLGQENFPEAMRQFERAAVLAKSQEWLQGEVMARYGLALTNSRRGNSRAARAEAEETLSLIESVPRDLPYESSEKSPEPPYLLARMGSYALLVQLLVRSPVRFTPEADKIRSFEVSESARWRTLREFLGSSRPGLPRKADPTLTAEYRRAREEVRRIEGERRGRRSGGLTEEGTLRSVREPVEKLRTLDARLRSPSAASPGRAAPFSLKEAQDLLDSETILLEYLLGDSRSFLWLVSSSSFEVFELPGRAEIESKARQLHVLLSESQEKGNATKAALVAADLSAVLLGPVAGRLGEKRLVIVPDGDLHHVPFAVLPDPAAGGERGGSLSGMLIAKHAIIYEPSASVLQVVRAGVSRRTPAPGLLAVLAAPDFASDEYAPLPYSREEAERISALVPADEKQLVKLGTEATRSLVLSGKLREFRFHHFATHGESHPEQPELSGIVLAEGDLWFQDIKNLDLPSDLVVLSACKTAIGREMQGEGFLGLAEGFMYAGAARVVVSLWNVNDRSTPALMERFYKGILTDNMSPAEALRSAQLWMAESTQWRSPYFWAGFTFHGEWRGDSSFRSPLAASSR